jgi:hypothetical protein
MEKYFYKKIFNIILCNFWHRNYSWQDTQHIQKLAIEDLRFLRYCRSRLFTFVFFMQKLSGTSSGKNNKRWGTFHHEYNKIGFAFFWFFCDFLYNLQETGKSFYYLSYPFAGRPSERSFVLQCGPWAAGRAGGGAGRGRARGGVGVP